MSEAAVHSVRVEDHVPAPNLSKHVCIEKEGGKVEARR